MLKNAINMLETKGFKLYYENDIWLDFRNKFRSQKLKFNKKNCEFILSDTITGYAVFVSWGLQKAITELFKVYDYRAMGLVQFICRELNLTRNQLAEKIPIDRYVLKRAEENVYKVNNRSLEKIIDYAESRGIELWK